MLFLQEIHKVRAGKLNDFELAFRDGWMVALANGDDARLVWYFTHVPSTSPGNTVLTFTAIKDGGAWQRLTDELTRGGLRPLAQEIASLRVDSVSSMLLPVYWSPVQELDWRETPADPKQGHEVSLYGLDVVWPLVLDDYIKFCEERWYRPMADGTGLVRTRLDIQACFQVAHGAGRRPECYLMQKVLESAEDRVRKVLAAEYAGPMRRKGHWMVDALEYRDQWQSKMLRTSTWSPLH